MNILRSSLHSIDEMAADDKATGILRNVFLVCVCVQECIGQFEMDEYVHAMYLFVKKPWTVFYVVIFITKWHYNVHTTHSPKTHSISLDDSMTTHFQCSMSVNMPMNWTIRETYGEVGRCKARRIIKHNNNKSKYKIVYLLVLNAQRMVISVAKCDRKKINIYISCDSFCSSFIEQNDTIRTVDAIWCTARHGIKVHFIRQSRIRKRSGE